jgi:hypothetical protein
VRLDDVWRGLYRGGTAVIDTRTPPRRIAVAVTALIGDDLIIVPRHAGRLLTRPSEVVSMTRAQLECLQRVGRRPHCRRDGPQLHRSKRTVQRDLTCIYRGLDVEGRKGALALIHDLGVLPDPRRELTSPMTVFAADTYIHTYIHTHACIVQCPALRAVPTRVRGPGRLVTGVGAVRG